MTTVTQYQPKPDALAATITINTSISSSVEVQGCTPVGLTYPAAMTSTLCRFLTSIDDGATFVALRNATGARVEYTLNAAGGNIPLEHSVFKHADSIAIEVDQAEAGERQFVIKAV